ncbi:hypothetical protein M2281_002727 [Mesorhizobium soli]|uniref:hypothetical protein n=1 Tax=Pseudaminobacter soli (ex Li et al. 2025) TaxID=1295366 RepID=UPI0024743FFD|nr:hypothetical protein [Mesorhizobium soli]MDH6232129.1 hypothetical protein [Mesorhizobium soli]
MSHACCGDPERQADHRSASPLRTADWLSLAASPTFAIMALLTSVLDSGSAEMLCSTMQGSLLSGMTTMYLLMSAFHSAPWLKLLARLGGGSKL